jgi:DNA-binding IclR family transcriptional regulator
MISAVQKSSGATGEPPQYPIESVDNALKVILLLGEHSELRMTEVSAHLGVATSTAHRILAMLAWRGFVRQNPQSKLYGPGPALTTIAFSVLRRLDIPQLAQPILEELTATVGETTHLGTLEADRTRFLAAAEPDQAVRVAPRLGKSFPAHCTSTGKALLSQLSLEQLHRLYPVEELTQVTSRSIATRTELEAELAQVRATGYAVNREESEDGVASVAVPVPVTSGLKLALNAAAPTYRLPPQRNPEVGAALIASAKRLAELLG